MKPKMVGVGEACNMHRREEIQFGDPGLDGTIILLRVGLVRATKMTDSSSDDWTY
jgi:hypothetical protein